MTQRIACFLAVGLLLGGSLAASAGEPISDPILVQRTYPVADLIIPVDDGTALLPTFNSAGDAINASDRPKPATLEDRLMHLIFSSVAPDSWSHIAGGRGTMDYFPLGMALVVNQTLQVHAQIAALLESLRENADKEVAVEFRVVTISEEMARQLQAEGVFDRFKCDKNQDAAEGPQVSILNDTQMFNLMERLQADKTSEVIQHPKLTMFNGQAATCQAMDYQWFVNDVQILKRGGQVIFVPQNKPIPFGWNFCVQPVVSTDAKEIRVKLNLTFTWMASATVPLFPITRFITPVFEGGAQGKPIPFTEFIQQPTVSTMNVNHTVNIPTERTAILSGWKIDRPCRWEGPPVLSQIPYVKDLFRQFTTGKESRYMLVMVTPRLVPMEASQTAVAPEATREPAPLAPECAPSTVTTTESNIKPVKFPNVDREMEGGFLGSVRKEMAALLVRKYQEACQKGLTDDAKSLAEEALRLDPACFWNPATTGSLPK